MMAVPSLTQSMARLLLAACLVAPLAACETGLQQQLDEKKAARFKAAADKVREVETVRTKAMEVSLPAADAEKTASKHPMVAWRAAGAEHKGEDGKTDDERLLEIADQRFQGTPADPAGHAGAAFAKEAAAFWRGDANLERYTKFLTGYVKSADEEAKAAAAAGNADFVQRPFVAEADFDQIFVHAARFYQLADMPPDVQLTTAFPYWQLAFEFESKPRESFSDYVTRLCRSKLAERCKGVPHEVRPAAINKPYLEWLQAKAEAFLASHPQGVFADVVKRYQEGLKGALESTPDLTEDPVLPATYSDRAASNGLRLVMSERSGVTLHDRQLAESFSGRLPGDLGAQAAEIIEELKNTPGNTTDFERVVLEMPGEASSRLLPAVFKAFPADVVRQVDLIGRRRADESLRRTGVLVRLPAPDEGETTSYQLKGQAEKVSCAYLGVAGKPPIGRKEPGSYLVVGDGRVRAAKLTRDAETRELSVGDLTLDAAADDAAAVAKWANGNEGIVRLFAPAGATYDATLRLVSEILYRCTDTEVAVDERGLQKVTVRCGDTAERDITLVVALCE